MDAQTPGTTLRGYVGVRWTDTRLNQVQIAVDGRLRDTTNRVGFFEVAGVAPGPHVVCARQVGFRPKCLEVNAMSGEDVDVLLALELLSVTLEPIIVEGGRLPARLIEVAHRVEQDRGDYVWREQIQRSGRTSLTDVLTLSPHVRIDYAYRHGRSEATPRLGMGQRECTPTLFVDGFVFPLRDIDLDMVIQPRDIEIIEVYRGVDVPLELGAGAGGCGVIAIWSSW